MCEACDYPNLLRRANVYPTERRLRILETIGDTSYPLSAREIYDRVSSDRAINRVTVYRILDNLVEHGLVQRLSSGERAFFYGLAPNTFHLPHSHFYCKQCGRMDCLDPKAVTMNIHGLKRQFSGEIDNIEVRIDGVCSKCLNTP